MRAILALTTAFIFMGCSDTSFETKPAMSDEVANTASMNDMARNAAKIHTDTLTLDTHIDIPLDYMDAVDPGDDTVLQGDLGKLEAGELDSAFFIIYTPQGALNDDGYQAAAEIATKRARAIKAMTETYSDRVALATTSNAVRAVVASGRHAVLIGMENAYPLGESVADIPVWAARGVRYVGITHFGHNQFGDSSNPNPDRDEGPRHNGLSELGRALIGALNDAGIMVDVSHAGKDTMMQAAELSRTPIIASHSGVTAVAESARNLDDEQLLKIAEVGGVAQMVALDNYVKPYTPEQTVFRDALRAEMDMDTSQKRGAASMEKRAEYFRRLGGMWDIAPRANVSDFVDHIDHAVKIAGMDHVGIASDFDGGGGIDGWEDASETANVTAELVKRGYSDAEIEKIWSGNLLRVLDAAQAAQAVKTE